MGGMLDWFGIAGVFLAILGLALDLPRRDRTTTDQRRHERMSPLAERIERLAENPLAWWTTLAGCLLTIIGIGGFLLKRFFL
jgi:hypothetical protein